ncbi:hypothetical protein EJB05_47897 [Eragrostis curvula]|uniref:RRP15-like protein n=1 Tax=Eragrostis curvula TaxID=38414 RepID=A0A5J9T0G3_9POAL|nr:hypothetical protein EJB05_47897 [Eragrostis curvula]
MAAAQQAVSAPPSAAAAANPGKRKRPSKGKGGKSKKKKLARSDEPLRRRTNKPSAKFLKLLKKRARDYNSDDDDEDDKQKQQEEEPPSSRRRRHDDNNDEEEALSGDEEEAASSSGDESGGTGAGGVTRFEQGCRAFRVAFLKIMSKKLPDDPLGPILLANKKLVAAKLAEDAEEHKPKAAARKEKREVSKAQKPRKDLNPSSTRDAKVLAKERKKTFLRELESTSHQDKKGQASSSFSKHIGKDDDEPGWAPLRDTYMLGSKLKDWDKMQDSAAASEQTKVPVVDSSDEE